MYETLLKFDVLLAIAAIFAAITCGILSSRGSVSLRKGRLRFAATLLFGSALCLASIGELLRLRTLPILSAEGVIRSAAVHSQGKGHRTDFTVTSADGATYHLNADGRSDYFRPDEHVVLTYRGYIGSVVEVHFIAASGAEEGIFRSTQRLEPFAGIHWGVL
jgi:hypothetical protein